MFTIHLEELARYIEMEGIESISSRDWYTITDINFLKLKKDFEKAKYDLHYYIINMLDDNGVEHDLKYGEY